MNERRTPDLHATDVGKEKLGPEEQAHRASRSFEEFSDDRRNLSEIGARLEEIARYPARELRHEREVLFAGTGELEKRARRESP
jgi:hypothetical protein